MPSNSYLIILPLLLKGFAWETGCERRQRRAGQRRKHAVDKIIKSGKRHCTTQTKDYSEKIYLHKVLFFLSSLFLSCFL